MSDSETKPSEQPETPAVSVSIEVVKKPTGELVKIARGEGGKFTKQAKTMPKTADVTRLMRNFLNSPEVGLDGKVGRHAKTRMQKQLDAMYKISIADPFQPVFDKFGNTVMVTEKDGTTRPLLEFDAKAAMASTQAFKELQLRAHGMPSKSEEELEAQKTQSVKVVILQHPELMDRTVYENKPREEPKPAFIDADIVENK
jgi:hypothetical protein